jgi:hypothetical protein
MQIRYLFFIWCTIALPFTNVVHDTSHRQAIVVIDPAGDVKRTGRRIGDVFERGLTLQCAEKIKQYIEQYRDDITVVITRMPGDPVYDLQNATLANRLHADLFINLNVYYTQDTKPTVYVYQFSYGNDFACCQQQLALYSYDQAYKINKHTTDRVMQLCIKELADKQYQALYSVAGPYALPIKPLIGVIAPALAFDCGLKSKESWHAYAEPLAHTIIAMLDKERE